ncbi:Ig-like domain-containing protein, partial [Enterococcus faecalis]
MKKKLSTYLSLFVMLSSFLTGPISAYAETVNPQENTTQSTDIQKENNETDVTNEDNKNGEEVQQSESSTTTTTEEPTKVPTEESTIKETTQSTEKQPRAPTRKKRATQDSVITSFSITDDKGDPLNHSVTQWSKFRINGTFDLPNNTVSAGDTTTITLPEQITFGDTQAFDLKDESGNVVAHAVIDPDSKTIVLTYTDYVENHSNVKGNFFFYARVDTKVIKENQTIPVSLTIENEVVIPAGNIEYEIDAPTGDDVSKSGWFQDGSKQDATFYIPINRSGKAFPAAVIQDQLTIPGAKIVPGSIIIEKGRWTLNDSNTDWVLKDSKDVTGDYNIQLNDEQNGLSIDFGDISSDEGFTIHYNVHLDYEAVDGEKITNHASLLSEKTVVTEVTSNATYYQGGGSGEGAVFNIHLHKSNEDGENLSGAEFEVIRDRNQQSFGTIVTDGSGNASVGNLLKDNYTIKETKAPDGYELLDEEIKITPEDFWGNKEAFKEVINKKIAPEVTEVKGTKTWDDNDNQDGKRPES